MPQQPASWGQATLFMIYVYITAALKKRNGRFEIILRHLLCLIERKRSLRKRALTGMYGAWWHMEVMVSCGGPTAYWAGGDGLGDQEGRF